jgi:chromosome segregation ATPase
LTALGEENKELKGKIESMRQQEGQLKIQKEKMEKKLSQQCEAAN